VTRAGTGPVKRVMPRFPGRRIRTSSTPRAGPQRRGRRRVAVMCVLARVPRHPDPTADIARATSDEGTPNPCASISRAPQSSATKFRLMRKRLLTKAKPPSGPLFRKNNSDHAFVKSIRTAFSFWYPVLLRPSLGDPSVNSKNQQEDWPAHGIHSVPLSLVQVQRTSCKATALSVQEYVLAHVRTDHQRYVIRGVNYQ